MQPWLTSEHTKYSNGDIALFRCVTSGSKPAADITWFVHNQPISDASATVTRQDREDVDGTFSSSSQLAVSVSRDMNGADVTCSVTNSVLISQGQGPREASMAVMVECEYAGHEDVIIITPPPLPFCFRQSEISPWDESNNRGWDGRY